MQILFAISTLCFLALVWAVVAIIRHVRATNRLDATSPAGQDNFAQHLLKASADNDLPRPRNVLSQNIREITARKSWNQPPEIITVRPSSEPRAETEQMTADPLQGMRKSPQTSHQSGMERLDWAYFNKDFGDLTDPYQTPRRIRANSRTS